MTVTEQGGATGSFSLLTIDDDEALRKSIRVYFEDSGIQVFEAANGLAGLDVFRAQRPDIVLVDLSMPVMGGLEFVDRLHAEVPDHPVIVVSGTGSLHSAVDALNKGVWDFVIKPVLSLAALEHTVRRCVERARLMRENENYRLHLERLVEMRTEELTRTRLEVVERLGRAAEYRDNETGMHVKRMSHYAYLLALKGGMAASEAELLRQAAPMHDIGKVGIPDGILLKEGKLGPAEWAIMMQHVQIGANILAEESYDLLRMARTVALTHHEKWNGEGYPNRLRGEEIPLVGRITAIADVFDALSSDRPYKKAWPVDEVLEWMRGEAGQHFDPHLIDLFIEILPDIVAVRERYAD